MLARRTDTQRGRSGRAGRGALVATSLGFAVIQLDVTVVNVAIRQIGRAFGAGIASMQWTVGAYTLTFAALMLTAGALGDRVGARRVFTVGFVLFVVASVACGLAPTAGVLIAARAVQGIGAAMLGACSLALLNHSFPEPAHRAKALAWWAAGASAALSGGPVIGGLLIAGLGWRSIFFINVPLGAVGIWLTVHCLEDTPRSRHRRLDLAGSTAATVALAALAAALIHAGSSGLGDPDVIAGLVLFGVAAAAFVVREARIPAPMLPLSLFRRRRFTAPALIGLCVNVCFYGLIFLFSLLFQAEHGLGALQTGLAFVPMTGAILASNLLTGRLSRGSDPAWTMLAGILAMIIACVALLWSSQGTPYAPIIAAQAVLGAGIGLLVPPMTGMLMASIERSRSGIASGTLTTMRQTGSLLGVALFGSLVAGSHGFYAGLHVALEVSIVVLAVSAGLAVTVTPGGPRCRHW